MVANSSDSGKQTADWEEFVYDAVDGDKGYNNMPHSAFGKYKYSPNQVAEAFRNSTAKQGSSSKSGEVSAKRKKEAIEIIINANTSLIGRKVNEKKIVIIKKKGKRKGLPTLTLKEYQELAPDERENYIQKDKGNYRDDLQVGDVVRIHWFKKGASKKLYSWRRALFQISSITTPENESEMKKYKVKYVVWNGKKKQWIQVPNKKSSQNIKDALRRKWVRESFQKIPGNKAPSLPDNEGYKPKMENLTLDDVVAIIEKHNKDNKKTLTTKFSTKSKAFDYAQEQELL